MSAEASPPEALPVYQVNNNVSTSTEDVPIPGSPLPELGYRKIASIMAREGSSCKIFRKFGQLNMLSLLSLQAEIMSLQELLRKICNSDDINRNLAYQNIAYSFHAMREQKVRVALTEGGDAQQQDNEQHRLLQEIRKKLTEYSK